ncbi:UMF1 family MFS transporter [Glaciihabitans tibetensis]|uniref:UMF1 family MFS transporter n=1 Tax=Glaciihabitans tibetensis TaxID=1266600 RepID=A0A2T0VCZ9_9MICO|nr:MFS transporter [Glaciihabitans tibetensis]PRY68052.1 UMF1 family MFS transporter [Glaciihabitans tibetensis]
MSTPTPHDANLIPGGSAAAPAATGALARVGLELQEGKVIPRRQVISWALWDWANQPFNTVVLTFIFTALYLTTEVFLPDGLASLPDGDAAKEAGLAELASGLGLGGTIAGLVILLIAPILGQRADTSGGRKRGLLIASAAVVVSMALLFFVEASPAYFVLGVALVSIGSVFSEIAGVNYNAMLVQVSTPKTVGKVSGLGWGLGYIGGILALVLVVVAYSSDWFGLPQEEGLPFRLVAVGCAVWTVVFTIPLILNVPEIAPAPGRERVSFLGSYVVLVKDIVRIYREARPTFWFLLASAVYRDGLAGVFAFGAIIASLVFDFQFLEVVIFGIAANLVAGISTVISGRFDDRFGPRAVIITALVGLVVAGTATFLLHDAGKTTFWVFGLALCLFVGPAQSASRSLLMRLTPAGREGEIFGLYATTGRAASFMSQAAWTILIAIFGAVYWGILGIVSIILIGLVMMLFVSAGKKVS